MAKDTSKAAYHAYRKALFDVGGKSKTQAEREAVGKRLATQAQQKKAGQS